MSVETKITCPLGSECERIVGGTLEVCAWYTTIKGKNPQTDEDIDEKKCAIAWLPILSVENTGTGRHIAASIQSLRNETITRQDAALGRLNEQITSDS